VTSSADQYTPAIGSVVKVMDRLKSGLPKQWNITIIAYSSCSHRPWLVGIFLLIAIYLCLCGMGRTSKRANAHPDFDARRRE